MDDFNIFCISNVDDPPKQLMKRDKGMYNQYIPTPLPEQLIIFGLGIWPSQVGELEVEIALTYKDENLSLGMLTEQTRAVCWEKNRGNIPSIMTSEGEQGMAKLCVEFITSDSTQSAQAKDFTQILKESLTDKEINESTPKVSKRGRNKDASKPVKQKRRQSLGKGEKTPTGPTPKRSKTGKAKALNTDPTTDKENIDTEGDTSVSPSSNKFTKMVEGGKPKVAICKDLTSRAPHPTSRWGHTMCLTDSNTAVVIGGQGERQQLSKDSVWCLNTGRGTLVSIPQEVDLHHSGSVGVRNPKGRVKIGVHTSTRIKAQRNKCTKMRGRPLTSSSDDEESDFRDIPFPQDAAMQQAFSDYQLQQMTSNFIDQFGFNEEEFQEQEEKADSPFGDRISSIDFNVQTGDDNSAASMFEQACNERIQQFDDNDSDEDIWEEKEITFSPNAQQQNRAARLPETRDDSDSTDSEEELDSPRKIVSQPNEKMDVDNSENWANFDDVATESVPVAMDTSPWSQTSTSAEASSSSEKTEKWADFSNKIPQEEETKDNWADFNDIKDLSSTDPGPRSSSPVAMDTNDVNSRPSAYLARSAPADLGSQVESSTEELRAEDLTERDSMVQEEEVSSTSDDVSSSSPPPSPRVSNSSPEQKASSEKPEEPSSSTQAIRSSPPSISPSPSGYISLAQSSGMEDEGSSVDAAPSSSVDPAPIEDRGALSSSDSSVDRPAESFLTSAGLMKSPGQLQGSGDKSLESNGPIPEPSNVTENPSSENVAQAKDTPEKKDTVPSSSPPTLQNGPV